MERRVGGVISPACIHAGLNGVIGEGVIPGDHEHSDAMDRHLTNRWDHPPNEHPI
jgi:hypothetical protein